MPTITGRAMISDNWKRATKVNPCPICGAVKYCSKSADGTVAQCMKESAGAFKSSDTTIGTAHFHRLKQSDKPATAKPKSYMTNGRGYPNPETLIASIGKRIKASPTRIKKYPGDYIVARFDRDGGKEFRPMHRNGKGWIEGDPDGPLPLYHADELDGRGTLYIGEGEDVADAGRDAGLAMITSSHGAGSAAKSDWSPVAQYQRVVITPDNDTNGEQYARHVAREVFSVNRSADVRIVRLPDLPPKGDMVEFVEAQRAEGKDDAAIVAYIEALAAQAKPLDPSEILGGLIVRKASTVQTCEVDWLWKPYLVAGAINLYCGMPCTGKGVFTMDAAARVSRGEAWPPIAGVRQPNPAGDVAIISTEDSTEATIVWRLKVAGADLERIHIIEAVRRPGDNGGMVKDGFDITRDIRQLSQLPNLRLVIIDPLDSHIGSKVDTNVGNKSRAALWPLKDWAEETGVCVLIVHHFNKTATTSAMDKVSGARSFGALPRSVWAVGEDEQGDRTIIAPVKMNLVPKDEKRPLAYRIVPSPSNPKHPIASWLDEDISTTANELVGERGSHARNDAEQFLRDVLGQGPVDGKEVLRLADEAGHAERTLRRAKDRLRIESEQVRDENGKLITGWAWRLP